MVNKLKTILISTFIIVIVSFSFAEVVLPSTELPTFETANSTSVSSLDNIIAITTWSLTSIGIIGSLSIGYGGIVIPFLTNRRGRKLAKKIDLMKADNKKFEATLEDKTKLLTDMQLSLEEKSQEIKKMQIELDRKIKLSELTVKIQMYDELNKSSKIIKILENYDGILDNENLVQALVKAYAEFNQYDSAENIINKYMERGNEINELYLILAYFSKNNEKKIEIYKKMLEEKYSAKTMFLLGSTFLGVKKYDEAEFWLKSAKLKGYKDIQLYTQYLKALEFVGNNKELLINCNEAYSLIKDDYDKICSLVEYYSKQNCVITAGFFAEKLLEDYSGTPGSSFVQGALAFSEDRPEKAIQIFKDTLERYPTDVNLISNLSRMYSENNQLKEAVLNFQNFKSCSEIDSDKLDNLLNDEKWEKICKRKDFKDMKKELKEHFRI